MCLRDEVFARRRLHRFLALCVLLLPRGFGRGALGILFSALGRLRFIIGLNHYGVLRCSRRILTSR